MTRRIIYSQPIPVAGLPWFRADEVVIICRRQTAWESVVEQVNNMANQFTIALAATASFAVDARLAFETMATAITTQKIWRPPCSTSSRKTRRSRSGRKRTR
jgi:hypothetical protein